MAFDPEDTPTPSQLERFDGHIDRALSRQLVAFKAQPNLEAWITAHVAQLEGSSPVHTTIEDVLEGVASVYDIDNGVGAQLDVVGVIVGRPREGLPDADYRLRLTAQILVNISEGTVEDVLAVARVLVGSGVVVKLQRFTPAAIVIDVEGVSPIPLADFARIICPAVSGGVRCLVSGHTVAGPYFRFDDQSSPSGTTFGYGDQTAPGGGGVFSTVLEP